MHISDLDKPQVIFLMANVDGNWIIAPNDEKSFGFVFKNMTDELSTYAPEVSKAMNLQNSGVASSGKFDFIYKSIYLESEIQVNNGVTSSKTLMYHIENADIVWKMMIELPSSTVHAITQSYFYKSLPYIVLFWLVLQILSSILIYTYKQSKEQLSELLLTASALENSADGVIVTDSDGVIVRVNESYSRISGYSREELLGKKTNTLSSGWTEATVYQQMWESLNSSDYWEGELKDRNRDGSLYMVWLRIVKIINPDSAEVMYVGIITDITHKKEAEEKISNLAYRDSLTNLPNRNLFNDRLRKAITQRYNKNEKLAVMFIDLDNFKFVNDSAGHLIGDKFLIEISNRFKAVVRDQDTLSRVGGDEFIILLKKVDDYTISDVARRLILSLANPITIDTFEFSTSASIGISLYPDDGDDAETLIKHADTAMYQAKNSGKNNYQFFFSSMNDELIRRVMLETNLAKALENDEFTIYYQPQIDAITNRIIGAEALLRWNNKELGVISPTEFIPICESTNKIIPITEWIVERVCRDIKISQQFYTNSFRIAINISSMHLKSKNFVSSVDSIVKKAFVEPSQIDLEITEGALVENIDDTTEKLTLLKSLGYKISLDDFGTGYSSLSYLKQFPFDKLKIDQSFIRDLPYDKQDIGIVRSIIAMTKALGLNVIAEGVETDENLKFLIEEGCVLIQGYYYSKPLPLDEYIEFVKNFNHAQEQ